MKSPVFRYCSCSIAVALAFFALAHCVSVSAQTADQEKTMTKSESVLLKKWIGPYGGVPPWRQVKTDEFVDAFEAAFELHDIEIDAIADNPEPPTFENTIVALEQSGRTLNQIETIFGVYASNLNTGVIPDLEKAIGPKLSKHSDSVTQNETLFMRVEKVYQDNLGEGATTQLDEAQQRLLKDRYTGFV